MCSTEALSLRLFDAGLWFVLIMFIYLCEDYRNEKERRRYSPLASYIAYVPGLLIYLPVMVLVLQKHRKIVFLHAALQLLPELFVFTLLLLALSPWLRKNYSARSCADLWILLGLLTYVFMYTWTGGFYPWLTVRLRPVVFWLLLVLWLGGFCAVMGWKSIEHFRFRRSILRWAVPASHSERFLFRQVWSALEPGKRFSRYGNRLKIIHSPAVSSPLTIGLFSRTICLALPTREYSEEELYLIFRHECIHLLRQDNIIKFSTVFLCAVGWFIPSLWIVMKRASEDLELCCDEIVTADMGKAARKQYAHLLLSSGGTEKGFTTCLSASARGLRYRLRRIMRPYGKRAVLLIGMMTALFLFFFGTIGVELDVGTVRTEFFDREDGAWHVTAVHVSRGGLLCEDPEVLKVVEDYLRDLQLARPLWKAYNENEDIFVEASVTLMNGKGGKAELFFDRDELYFLHSDDSAPKPLYRIIGDFDPDWLRGMAKSSK